MPDVPIDFVSALDSFTPPSGNWLPLETLLEQIFSRPVPPAETAAMLRLFERFPAEDGAGVFWSIVHGLEALPHYQALLFESVQRVPSELGVTMLGRILNSGQREIAGNSISTLLAKIQSCPRASPTAKRSAHAFQVRNA
jgi:hypothetical protein